MNRRTLAITIGVVAAVVVLVTVFDMILADHPPAVAGLEAPQMVVPSGTSEIVCLASDRDGDVLSYNWSASGGSISGTGAVVNWTAPELPGSYNITVIVTDKRGQEVTKQIGIAVRANSAPTISSLVADPDWTSPLGTIRLTCEASDPDEDELTYEWTATGGDISGTGAVVNWTARQEPGIYDIAIMVEDSHASSDTMSTCVSVNLATPPIVDKIVVTPVEHIYLRDCTAAACDFDVWKTREYDIECTATGTGEVFYDWSCTDGSISGTGSNITWTAPNKQSTSTVSVDATVTVIVSDGAGNTVIKDMVFHVPTCSCGSWGLKSGELPF